MGRPAATKLLSALRVLRRPRVIVAQVAVLTAALGLTTVVPQSTASDIAAFEAFCAHWPQWSVVVRAVGLDRVVGTWWFLALVALASLSLVLLQIEQWRGFVRLWRARPGRTDFVGADFRVQWERPATEGGLREEIRSRGRLNLLGSPLFHSGLLLVIAAGLLRMLLGRDAVIDLVQGETLQSSADVWAASWGGPLAPPFAIEAPIVFRRLEVQRYPSGALKELAATMDLQGYKGRGEEPLAVNTPLDIGAERIYMTVFNGPTALLEMQSPEGTERRAVMLQKRTTGVYEAVDSFPGGFEVRLRANTGNSAHLPSGLELRVTEGRILRHVGRLEPGDVRPVAPLRVLQLHGITWWTRFRGSRDQSLGLAYLGLGLVSLGALLIFAVVRVDTAVVVAPLDGGRERVTVALKAARFAPLYQDAFDALVAANGPRPDADREETA